MSNPNSIERMQGFLRKGEAAPIKTAICDSFTQRYGISEDELRFIRLRRIIDETIIAKAQTEFRESEFTEQEFFELLKRIQQDTDLQLEIFREAYRIIEETVALIRAKVLGRTQDKDEIAAESFTLSELAGRGQFTTAGVLVSISCPPLCSGALISVEGNGSSGKVSVSVYGRDGKIAFSALFPSDLILPVQKVR